MVSVRLPSLSWCESRLSAMRRAAISRERSRGCDHGSRDMPSLTRLSDTAELACPEVTGGDVLLDIHVVDHRLGALASRWHGEHGTELAAQLHAVATTRDVDAEAAQGVRGELACARRGAQSEVAAMSMEQLLEAYGGMSEAALSRHLRQD
eukprot:SAG11_NODE_6373_length_1327_cov_0.964169_2_plen_151_part_00